MSRTYNRMRKNLEVESEGTPKGGATSKDAGKKNAA